MHYLDHAATTPLRDSAREAWLEAADELGNPSSLHAAGRRARARVEDARERIAAALGAHPTEVLLTSGGTEADNLAIKGLAWAATSAGPVITTPAEHHAALDPVRWLDRRGHAPAEEVPVGPDGVVDLGAVRAALPGARAVSVHWVNNETGVIQPIPEIVAAANDAGVPVHSDAVQAIAHLPVNFGQSGLATMAVSAHKLGGPVGVGALIARRDITLEPLAHGGGQERLVRSGTVDAAGAAAFAAALDEAVAEREEQSARLTALRDLLADGLRAAVDDVRISGATAPRAPHVVHAIIPGADSEAMLYLLDSRGIAASSGSACTAGVVDASHVALAMGASEADATCTLRLSLGRTTTRDDVDAALAAIPEAVAAARAASGYRR